ncbi:MAG: coproporphyrinogen dehydrogenase HemZ [Clostridia bacterium]|nr:coproporphyrinogen dehydrogenase HemZ [Clostridia bacterium]
MVNSDLKWCEKELNEMLYFFDGGAELSVRHLFDMKENKVVNTIVIDGKKSYAFGNLISAYSNEIEEKRYIKRYAKLALYKALSAFKGQTLPWGALTGIRPTKLAYYQLNKEGEFKDFFKNTMKVSDEKIALTESVLNSQQGIYNTKNDNSDLFVFIPFCPSRCKYCSFISQDLKSVKNYVNDYIDALIYEIEYSKKYIKNLRSIYVGGGTPASLDSENLRKLLSKINEINTGVEFTFEAGRPDCINSELVSILGDYRVNRVCVNPQTFSDDTLKKIGRKHTSEDIYKAYDLVKDKFIVNMDLIAGLEDETLEMFKESIDKTIELSPDNITVHSLSVKRGSYLKDETDLINPKEIKEMIDYAESKITECGYNPYYIYRQKYMAGNLENVGFSKKGKECVFNINSMEEISDCIACGANAISKKIDFANEKIERYANCKDIKTYLEKIDTILKEKDSLFIK